MHQTNLKPLRSAFHRCLVIYCLLTCCMRPAISQVNLQTGSASFNLPLFSWQDHKSRLSSAVDLDYQSGNGLKTDEVASSVGQGWNLLAGGVITRMQVGEPDDQKPRDGNVEDVTKYPAGYLYASNSTEMGCPKALAKYPLFRDKNHIYKQHNSVGEDRELDQFSFRFNGRTGLFVVSKREPDQVLFLDDNTLKGWFERDEAMPGIRTTITAFNIQDENGVIYRFRQHGLTKALKTGYCDAGLTQLFTQPEFKGNHVYHEAAFDRITVNPFIINSWYLSEMEDVLTHRVITFNYETRTINASAGADLAYYQQPDYSVISHKTSVSVTPALTSVTYPDGHLVTLEYGQERVDLAGDLVLSAVEISYYGRVLSRHQLTTSYFILNRYGTPVTDYQKRCARLCLLSVKKYGPDRKGDDPPYLFDYYTGSGDADDVVPPPFSHLKDIWGYYNGNNSVAANNTGLSLTAPLSSLANYQLKGLCFIRDGSNAIAFNAKPGYAKNGLLRQVVYATGSSLRYEYEQNTTILEGQNTNAGGVHVARTSVSDGGFSNGCSNPIITQYNYNNAAGAASSLWGVEMPVNKTSIQTYYQAEYKDYKYSFPFGKCYYRFQYPGILSTESKVGISSQQQFMLSLSKVLNVVSAGMAVVDVVSLCMHASPMAWAAVILDIIGGVADIVFTCFTGAPTQDETTTIFYNSDLNAANPLPIQFKRVEVVTATGGKTVHAFTSSDDYELWAPTNPSLAMRQRYGYWAYGLPLTVSVYDNAGYLVKQTINHYDFLNARITHEFGAGHQVYYDFTSCKCTVTKSSSQRNTNWENPDNYTGVANYTTSSTSELTVDRYPIYSGRVMLGTTYERVYRPQSTVYAETQTSYGYNMTNHLVNSTTTLLSNGDKITKNIKYSCDYSTGMLASFNGYNMLSVPVSSTTGLEKPGQTYAYLDEKVTEFTWVGSGDIKPARILEQRFNQPVPGYDMQFYQEPGSPFNPPGLKETQTFTYDVESNLVGIKDEGQHVITNLYNYDNKYITASVINADYDIDHPAYTSFEGESLGGWSAVGFGGLYVGFRAVTGTSSYLLSRRERLRSPLNADKAYKLTFWAADGAVYLDAADAELVTTVEGPDNFIYYEYNIPQGKTSVDVFGDGFIDELRLYPQTARMRTVCYDPVIGKQCECDENNRITYYEYDALARIRFIKNEKGDVVKMYEYNTTTKHGGCPEIYYNHAISEEYTKNNCPAGYAGGSVTYTVPANKYSSAVSQADADLQVENELNTLAQAYANTNGACLPIYYSVATSQTYTCDNCPEGTVGQEVTYTVPAGSYSSLVSQAAADEMAMEDAKANVVTYAREHPVCLLSFDPAYEGTGLERCQVDGNGATTGHQEVELIDKNPNSATYNQKIWIDLGENTAVCPATVTLDFILDINESFPYWMVTLTDNSNNATYDFDMIGGSGILGPVPAGTYTVSFNSMNPNSYLFNYYYAIGSCNATSSGLLGTQINNVIINSGCKQIYIHD